MTMEALVLPFFTADLPGCGGRLKAEPAHFVVEEAPLYPPDGAGPHLHVCLTREGWTTRQVVEALARLFDLRPSDIGYAGMKDRHARCTQVFSLPGLQAAAAQRIAAELPFEVLWAQPHRNKLKLGHLLGNHFQIMVTDLDAPVDEARQRAQAIAAVLAQRGLPNFFGPQRFGIDGANVARGRAALLGAGPRDKWLRRLLISAYQSHLFNMYLQRRLALHLFDRLLLGDVAKKTDTGGMFDVKEPIVEQPRFDGGEINFTGPIYGFKMWAAKDKAAELEAVVLQEAELTMEHLRRARVEGSRRPGRLLLRDLNLTVDDAGLHLAFFLPKSAYATVVVREFTKVDVDAAAWADESEDEG